MVEVSLVSQSFQYLVEYPLAISVIVTLACVNIGNTEWTVN